MAKVTSINAIRDLISSGKALTQAQELYQVLYHSSGMTRQELCAATGISINAVCGRVAELQSQGKVKTGIVRSCHITGKQVETLYAVATGESK